MVQKKILFILSLVVLVFIVGCPKLNTIIPPQQVNSTIDTNTSEIALAILGGVSNDGVGLSNNYTYASHRPQSRWWGPLIRDLFFMSTAEAYGTDCSGGSMNPSIYSQGTSTYNWTPTQCYEFYVNGSLGVVSWSGTYTYTYSTNCTGFAFYNPDPIAPNTGQSSNCFVTRTTPNTGSPVGVTRTIVGQDSNIYAVTHDTNTPSGYNSSIATSNAGETIQCQPQNSGDVTCTERIINISGSHVSATVTPSSGGSSSVYWNHTVSSTGPITVTNNDTGKIILSGSLIVQDNINQFYATATITNALTYTLQNCCYPTAGNIATTFTGGPYNGQTATVYFTTGSASNCGEVLIAPSNGGVPIPYTLQHCL